VQPYILAYQFNVALIVVNRTSRGDPVKASSLALSLFSAALFSSSAFANLELAQKNACTACHTVDKKLVGPAYQDVAKKYAGQKDASVALTASIQKGGAGKWGPVPMPAQPNLSEADAETLAAWILGLVK
jgi:cytochrome c